MKENVNLEQPSSSQFEGSYTLDWLILLPKGGSWIFIPVSKLKEDGIYEAVLSLAKKYGKRYNK